MLFHSGAATTLEALPDVIAGLREKGYCFTTVGDLLLKGETVMDHTGSPNACKAGINQMKKGGLSAKGPRADYARGLLHRIVDLYGSKMNNRMTACICRKETVPFIFSTDVTGTNF